MGEYVCYRSNVYAGMLIKKIDYSKIPSKAFPTEMLSSVKGEGHIPKSSKGVLLSNEEYEGIKKECRNLTEDTFLRDFLFVHTFSERFGNDLAYTNSSYGTSARSPRGKVDPNFIIDNSVRLDELLRFLGYKENLTQGDVNKIYRTLFCSQRILHGIMRKYGVKYDENDELTAKKSYMLPCSLEVIRCLDVISSRKHHKPSSAEPNYKIMKKKR